jgi:membrane-associated phospholipid phosphatase
MEWLTGYAVFHWITAWSNPPCDGFFRAVTDLGSPTAYYLAVAPLFWVVDRRKATALFLLLIISAYVNSYTKLLVHTTRPDPALARVLDVRPYLSHSYAFPSGHTQGAVVFWSYLAWWVGRRWFTAIAMLAIALISFSRLYLGVHFPIDIIGGIVLGLTLLPLLKSLDRWADRDCYTPPWAMAAIVAGTFALAVTGTPPLAMISGSATGFLLGASWLPQRALTPTTPRQAVGIVALGLALQFGLASALGLITPYDLPLVYVTVAVLWVFALWVYPRLLTAFWLRPRLAAC